MILLLQVLCLYIMVSGYVFFYMIFVCANVCVCLHLCDPCFLFGSFFLFVSFYFFESYFILLFFVCASFLMRGRESKKAYGVKRKIWEELL